MAVSLNLKAARLTWGHWSLRVGLILISCSLSQNSSESTARDSTVGHFLTVCYDFSTQTVLNADVPGRARLGRQRDASRQPARVTVKLVVCFLLLVLIKYQFVSKKAKIATQFLGLFTVWYDVRWSVWRYGTAARWFKIDHGFLIARLTRNDAVLAFS